MNTTRSDCKTTVWFLWGWFDVLCIALYVTKNLRHDKIPYLAAWEMTLTYWGMLDPVQGLKVVLSWVLQVSLFVSCFLFFAQREAARWVGYAQIPLRIFFITPSVSILVLGAQFFPGYSTVLMTVLVMVSELMKFWSLRKFGSRAVAC